MAKAKTKEVVQEVETEKKLGINDLSEVLNIKPASARVRLRAASIKKAGRSYEWTQEEFDNVVAELQAEAPEEAKPVKTKAKKLKAAAEPVSEGTEEEEETTFFDDSNEEY